MTDQARTPTTLAERLEQCARHVDREMPKLMDACISASLWPHIMCEAASALLATAQREAALREALIKFGRHSIVCSRGRICSICGRLGEHEVHEHDNHKGYGHDFEPSENCSCGFDAATAAPSTTKEG